MWRRRGPRSPRDWCSQLYWTLIRNGEIGRVCPIMILTPRVTCTERGLRQWDHAGLYMKWLANRESQTQKLFSIGTIWHCTVIGAWHPVTAGGGITILTTQNICSTAPQHDILSNNSEYSGGLSKINIENGLTVVLRPNTTKRKNAVAFLIMMVQVRGCGNSTASSNFLCYNLPTPQLT
jgi:hypothetical protein